MLKILLVDDEPAILGVFKDVLELSSFAVHTAASSSEAVRRSMATFSTPW
ncbi:MAG: hypothetical protein ACXVZV_09650 [Terriglobales bacterium]